MRCAIDLFFVVICVLAMAVMSGIVLHRLKIPTIIGYILTGVLTAYIFEFRVEKAEELNRIAEFGIVFLMFMIGLDFNFKTMSSMKQEVLLFGGLQIGISIATFFVVCFYLFGFNFATSIIVASAVSLSSTAIVLKYLNESNQTKTQYGNATVGILIFQDIAVIPILLMIKLLSDKNSDVSALLLTTGISAILVLAVLFLPWKFLAKVILRFAANMKTDEIFVGTVLLIVLGAAYISQYFGFSLSLGAFLAGMIISNTTYKYQVASVLIYFRDILLGIFFITVGMQVNLLFLSQYFFIILLFVLLMMGGKTFLIYIFLKFFRGDKIGMRVAISLSQIGEFSFAIFLLASQYKILNLTLDGGILKYVFGEKFFTNITPIEIHQFLTLMVIFSMIAAPFILDNLDKSTEFMLKYLRIPIRKEKTSLHDSTQNQPNALENDIELENHIIICGYGLLGQEVATYFRGCNVRYICIDSQYKKVEHGVKNGDNIIYGDIAHKSLFRRLHVDKCACVLLTIENQEILYEACRNIKSLAHHCKIIAVTTHTQVETELRNMGLYAIIHERKKIAEILGYITLQAMEEDDVYQNKSVATSQDKTYYSNADFHI